MSELSEQSNMSELSEQVQAPTENFTMDTGVAGAPSVAPVEVPEMVMVSSVARPGALTVPTTV